MLPKKPLLNRLLPRSAPGKGCSSKKKNKPKLSHTNVGQNIAAGSSITEEAATDCNVDQPNDAVNDNQGEVVKANGCYVRVENIGDSKRRSSSRDEESEAEVVSPPKKRGRKAGSKKKTRGKPKIVTVEEEECDKCGEIIRIRQR